VLTKSIGTGIIATALKAGLATTEALNAMVSSICALNKTASEVAVNFDLKACTDITGFGLAGHLVEMARAGKCLIEISAKEIPVLPGALEGAVSGLIPGGAYANRKYFASWTRIDEKIPTPLTDVMFDPQTSGGLVIGVPENKLAEFTKSLDQAGIRSAKIIGKVVAQHQEGLLEVLE
jgi:selenide,water dikinase